MVTMRKFIYAKMALTNIKNNSKIYFPYILTCIGTVAVFYIMYALSEDPGLNEMSGGTQLGMLLSSAMVILGFFGAIFLFYTNSFLIKRRKKEFGIYNILGMEKKHISKMMLWETIFTALIGLLLGLLAGIIFSKLAYLLLLAIMNAGSVYKTEVTLRFNFSAKAAVITLILFAAIFFLNLLNTLRQIHLSNPIQLLKGSEAGEREPKIKWPLVVIGLLTLGGGYYLAVVTDDILSALALLIVAILLVIIGTYCLFTSISIAVLKLLRKSKGYYYNARHFTSVSGMLYRMKQNAVGLANICILSTAVLVTLSTTVSLYIGMEDVTRTRFPRNVILNFEGLEPETENTADEEISAILSLYKQSEVNPIHLLQAQLSCIQSGQDFSKYDESLSYSNENACNLFLIAREDYEEMTGDTQPLGDQELFIQTVYGPELSDTITLNGTQWHIQKSVENIDAAKSQRALMVNAYYLVMPNRQVIRDIFAQMASGMQQESIDHPFTYYYAFDLNCSEDIQIQITDALSAMLSENDVLNGDVEGAAQSRDSFFGLYGGLFFIGIFIGLLFIMATVLIIYYKQISEGYDDKDRYAIMQKVGMSLKEIRRTIHSQVLTVFFLPLGVACVHLAFAFPLLSTVLQAFNFSNTPLYIMCCIGTVIVFALLYAVVYGLTARVYYKIVSNKS